MKDDMFDKKSIPLFDKPLLDKPETIFDKPSLPMPPARTILIPMPGERDEKAMRRGDVIPVKFPK